MYMGMENKDGIVGYVWMVFLVQYNFNSRITRLGNGLDCILKLLRVLFMGVFMHLLR